ncbi:MAG: hypothetical protein AB8H12_05785 [Lewinella sp.]
MIARLANRAKKVNWKYLLTEVLLIVIGINVGLWFSNISKNDEKRQQEKEILTEMLTSLRTDKKDMQENLKIHQEGLEAAGRLLLPLDSLKPGAAAFDLVLLWRDSYFVSDNTSYETLKNYGLNLVRDSRMRQDIVRLYNECYRMVEEAHIFHRRRVESFDPVMVELFDYKNQRYVFRDPTLAAIPDKSYQIKTIQNAHYYVASTYRDNALPQVDSLITYLETALR